MATDVKKPQVEHAGPLWVPASKPSPAPGNHRRWLETAAGVCCSGNPASIIHPSSEHHTPILRRGGHPPGHPPTPPASPLSVASLPGRRPPGPVIGQGWSHGPKAANEAVAEECWEETCAQRGWTRTQGGGARGCRCYCWHRVTRRRVRPGGDRERVGLVLGPWGSPHPAAPPPQTSCSQCGRIHLELGFLPLANKTPKRQRKPRPEVRGHWGAVPGGLGPAVSSAADAGPPLLAAAGRFLPRPRPRCAGLNLL